MSFFLANCSLPPDFQQLCSCFLCVWLGIIPFFSSCPDLTVVVITTGPSLVYLSGLGHTSAATRDDIMSSGCKISVWWKRRATLPFLDSHSGLDMSLHHYGCGSLHLWRYKGKKFIVADAEFYKAPHCLAHPCLSIVGDTDILQRDSPTAQGFQRNMCNS